MIQRVFLAAAFVAIATPIGAAQPESWTVTCVGARQWTNTTAPNTTGGAFQFTLPDGTEVRTTAGLNCWATRAPAKAS